MGSIVRRSSRVAVCVVLGFLLTACGSGASPEGSEAHDATSDLISGVARGSCTTLAALADEPMTFPEVDCDEEHDAEVVGLIKLDGDELPSVVELEERGQAECTTLMGEYLSDGAEASDLTMYWIRPTDTQWEEGIRVMPCIATGTAPWSGRL